MATPVEITYRVVGADQVAGALQQMENRARQMSSAMTGTMAPARQGVAALSSSLSHAASIMQQTGGATAELAQRLQTAILAISSATVAIQALRGITLAWAGAMAIANTALLALTASLAPFLAAAVIVGLVLAAGAGMVSGMKQVVELAPRMDAGLASTRTRMDEFKLSADDAAAGMRMGQLAAKDLREEMARKATQLAATAAAQKKLADAIRETRIQGELNLIVSTITAERARDIENALRRQAQFLRDAATAEAQAAQRLANALAGELVIREHNAQAVEAIEARMQEQRDKARELTQRLREELQADLDFRIQAAGSIAEANREAAIASLNAWLESLFAQGRATVEIIRRINEIISRIAMAPVLGAFAILQQQLSENLIKIQNMFVEKFGALGPLIFQSIRGIGDAVGNLFGDLVRGAKSFGESIADFFKGIAESILNVFQQLVANAAVSWILSLILPGLGGFRSIFKMLTGFAQGGIVAGGLTPIFAAAQGGGIVSRPTLALMGEGGQDEMVLNRRQAREFIGLPEGQTARPREAVIHLTIHNVIGDPRALGIMTAGDVAGVIVNDVSRRGPTIQAIRVALA